LANLMHHLGGRHHISRAPTIARAHVHGLNQAQFHPLVAGQLGQGQQLVVIASPHNHGVELEGSASRIETGCLGMVDRGQNPLEGLLDDAPCNPPVISSPRPPILMAAHKKRLLLVAGTMVASNLVVDLLYGVLDPRLRAGKMGAQ
jgi:hypothetical protein